MFPQKLRLSRKTSLKFGLPLVAVMILGAGCAPTTEAAPSLPQTSSVSGDGVNSDGESESSAATDEAVSEVEIEAEPEVISGEIISFPGEFRGVVDDAFVLTTAGLFSLTNGDVNLLDGVSLAGLSDSDEVIFGACGGSLLALGAQAGAPENHALARVTVPTTGGTQWVTPLVGAPWNILTAPLIVPLDAMGCSESHLIDLVANSVTRVVSLDTGEIVAEIEDLTWTPGSGYRLYTGEVVRARPDREAIVQQLVDEFGFSAESENLTGWTLLPLDNRLPFYTRTIGAQLIGPASGSEYRPLGGVPLREDSGEVYQEDIVPCRNGRCVSLLDSDFLLVNDDDPAIGNLIQSWTSADLGMEPVWAALVGPGIVITDYFSAKFVPITN